MRQAFANLVNLVYGRLILIGIGLGVAFWAIESVMHVYVFHRLDFVHSVLSPGFHEIWMRLIIVGMFISFGAYAQWLMNARRRAQVAVGLAHAELTQIFETSADAMRVVDKDFTMLRANDTFCTLAGTTKDEAIGKKCHEVFRGPLLKLEKRKPKLHDADRAFWIALRKAWADWTSRLLIVKPETVVDWQTRRFRRHWARISQQGRHPGRPRVEAEIRELIRQMVRENHWGAPRILSELQKLGFLVSETTVSRYVRRFREHKPDPDLLKRWISFLRNHKDAIAGMDFFTVPTATLNVLYGFFVIHHGRRRILHFNATYSPTAQWVMQQLREAFPFDSAPRHLIFDRDSIFCPAVVEFVKALGTKPRRIAYRSPWQNPVAERWIGSLRRELLDHVVVLSQHHLVQLVKSYIRYHHEDRCHLGLERDTPEGRPVTSKPSPDAKVVALSRVGGLHHRYVWREAA